MPATRGVQRRQNTGLEGIRVVKQRDAIRVAVAVNLGVAPAIFGLARL
jgi:hypothetical protein